MSLYNYMYLFFFELTGCKEVYVYECKFELGVYNSLYRI